MCAVSIIYIVKFILNSCALTRYFRQCRDVNDTFSSSVIYKVQEKWAVCLSYRLMALNNWFNRMKAEGSISIDILTEVKTLTKTVVQEIVR
jgi:predicted nucleic acid-binding protein